VHIRAATTIGARILHMAGKLGTLRPGAYADLLLIDGNPLNDLGLFQDQGKHLAATMKPAGSTRTGFDETARARRRVAARIREAPCMAVNAEACGKNHRLSRNAWSMA
jgi:cytosine/adenosine deaminase-related metal-dependent hydrolase